jgi:hypothetical protein
MMMILLRLPGVDHPTGKEMIIVLETIAPYIPELV